MNKYLTSLRLQEIKLKLQKSDDPVLLKIMCNELIDGIIQINEVNESIDPDIFVTLDEIQRRNNIALNNLGQDLIKQRETSSNSISWSKFILLIILIFGLPMTAIISYNIGAKSISHSQPHQP
jgi:hypothetical protein